MKTFQLNLYIVDDDKDVRESLAALFIARHYRVQAFDSGESFLAKADLQSCGCVILDIDMDPGMSGLLVFDELRRVSSPLLAILLSGVLNVPTAASYMEKGVFYCLEKTCETSVLLQRVEQAMQRAADIAVKVKSAHAVMQLWNTLTPREKDVARLNRHGWVNKRIADTLDIGVRAVETHNLHLFKKLELRNSTELDRLMRDNDIQ
jgi:FixJ family two-component response regulator